MNEILNWGDIKQRLLKLDTLHGLIWVPTGILMLWASFYALQYVIQIAAVVGALYLIVEGLKKFASNPVKASAALYLARMEYIAKREFGLDTQDQGAQKKADGKEGA